MARIGKKLRSRMGGCFSLHRKQREVEAEEEDKGSGFINTRFKGLSPEESGSISQRKTLASIMNETQGAPEHDLSQASMEEVWFDAEGRLASDSDDEFMSVNGDFASAGNSLSLPRSGPTTPRPTFATLKEQMLKETTASPPGTVNGRTEYIPGNKLHHDEDKKSTVSFGRKLDATPRNSSVSVAPVSDASTEFETGKHGSQQHSKAEYDGCLPCLLNTVASFDKRSPQRRRSFRLFSSKRRSCDTDLHDVSKILHRPLAGLQVPMSDGSHEGSWSRVSPSSFKLRSRNYMKDKKKQPAAEWSIFEAAGVDVFLSAKKIDHISRFVDFSALADTSPSSEKFPLLFVFNIQVPLYTASLFPFENDGEGLNLVFYYRLSEAFLKEGPPHLKEMLTRLLDDDHEKIKGLVADTVVPFRERLKIVARVLNPDEIHLNAPERKLAVTYNEKPVLSRPQHSFYKGSNYFEVDLDVHRFNFIARKAVEAFRERLKLCVLDIGLTIQGNKPEELPEYMLCCARISRLNINAFKYLRCDEDTAVKPNVVKTA